MSQKNLAILRREEEASTEVIETSTVLEAIKSSGTNRLTDSEVATLQHKFDIALGQCMPWQRTWFLDHIQNRFETPYESCNRLKSTNKIPERVSYPYVSKFMKTKRYITMVGLSNQLAEHYCNSDVVSMFFLQRIVSGLALDWYTHKDGTQTLIKADLKTRMHALNMLRKITIEQKELAKVKAGTINIQNNTIVTKPDTEDDIEDAKQLLKALASKLGQEGINITDLLTENSGVSKEDPNTVIESNNK